MTKRKETREAVAERVRTHSDEQKRRGLARVSVWVPEKDTERLKDIACQLRQEAGLSLPADGRELPRRVEVPSIEPRHSSDETVWLEIGPEEKGLQMLLRANRGLWRGQKGLWEVPAYLPARLGLTGRLRALRGCHSQDAS